MTKTMMTNSEATGEQPVVLAESKPSPVPRAEIPVDIDTADDDAAKVDRLVARVAELEAQATLTMEWAVQWSPETLFTYSTEEIARDVHRGLGLPPEALKCSHVRRGPFVSVTS